MVIKLLKNNQVIHANPGDIIELYENNAIQVFRVLDSINEKFDCYRSKKVKMIKKINVKVHVFSYTDPDNSKNYKNYAIWMNVNTKNVYIKTPQGWILLYTLVNNKTATNYVCEKKYNIISVENNKVAFFPFSVEANQFQVEGTGEIIIEER